VEQAGTSTRPFSCTLDHQSFQGPVEWVRQMAYERLGSLGHPSDGLTPTVALAATIRKLAMGWVGRLTRAGRGQPTTS
jgi:hypothetical protein